MKKTRESGKIKDSSNNSSDSSNKNGNKQPEPLKEDKYKEIPESYLIQLEKVTEEVIKNTSDFTDEEVRKTIKDYTDEEYQEINDALAKGSKNKSILRKSEILKNILERGKLGMDGILYKGTKMEHFEGLKIGDTMKIKPFYSTTTQKGIMDGFIKHNKYDAELHIKAGPETKGLFLDGVSKWGNEKEFLIQAGTNFKCLNIEKVQRTIGGKMRELNKITLEVVKDG